jgi:hypothetical protein
MIASCIAVAIIIIIIIIIMSSIIDTTHGGKARGYIRDRCSALSDVQSTSTIKMLSHAIADGVEDWDAWWDQRLKESLAELSVKETLDADGTLTEEATDALIAVMHSTAWMLAHFRGTGKDGEQHRIGASMLAEDLIRLSWEPDRQKSRMAHSSGWKWMGWQNVQTEMREGLHYRPEGKYAQGETVWDGPSTLQTKHMAFTVSKDPKGVVSESQDSMGGIPVVKLDPSLIAGTLSLAGVTGNGEPDQARKLRKHARELLRSATESADTTLKVAEAEPNNPSSSRFHDTDAAHADLQTLHTAARALLLTGVSPLTIRAAVTLQGESAFQDLVGYLYSDKEDPICPRPC